MSEISVGEIQEKVLNDSNENLSGLGTRPLVLKELPVRSEVDDSPEARAEDIKKFWDGFFHFRMDNIDLESELRSKIQAESDLRGNVDLQNNQIKVLEGAMLFAYGVHLARAQEPELSRRLPTPEIRFDKKSGGMSYSRQWYEKTGEVVGGWFSLNPEKLLKFQETTTALMAPYFSETTKSASQHFTDREVVDLIVSASEESAHHMFVNLKQGEKLIRATQDSAEVLANYKKISEQVGAVEAAKVYHTSDIERRGLVWRQRILERYFPHWVNPVRKFVNEIREMRLDKSTSRKSK